MGDTMTVIELPHALGSTASETALTGCRSGWSR